VATVALAVAAGFGFVALEFVPRLVPMEPEDSHALDRLSRPFHLAVDDSIGAGILAGWGKSVTPFTIASAALLALMLFFPRQSKDAVSPPRRHVSNAALAAVTVVLALTWGVGTTVIYFPSAVETLDQLKHPEGDLSGALAGDDRDAASLALSKIDRLAARGQFGSWLRFDRSSSSEFADVRRAVLAVEDRLDDPAALDFIDGQPVFLQTRRMRSSAAE
jgi:hypothetical protein